MSNQRVRRKTPTAPLTAERLRELLDYDPATGVFTWKRTIGRRAVTGRRAGGRRSGKRSICIDYRPYPERPLAFFYVNGRWAEGDVAGRGELREVSRAETVAMAPPSRANKSGRKGVSWRRKTGRWRAQIMMDRRQLALGEFDLFADAVEARERAEARYFGAASAKSLPNET